MASSLDSFIWLMSSSSTEPTDLNAKFFDSKLLTKQLDGLPTESLEDRMSRWMVWSNECDKRNAEPPSNGSFVFENGDFPVDESSGTDPASKGNAEKRLEVSVNEQLPSCQSSIESQC